MTDVLYIDPDGDKLRGSVDPDGNFTLRLESGMRSLLLKVMKGDVRGLAERMIRLAGQECPDCGTPLSSGANGPYCSTACTEGESNGY